MSDVGDCKYNILFFRMEGGEVEDEILSEGGHKLSLERLEMLRVIGTGTFARVCLCQVCRLGTLDV